MATLFIISIVELSPELLRLVNERRRQGKFKRFFGTAVFKDDVRLVFGHRRLKPNLPQNPFVTYYQPSQTPQGSPIPEGVTAWLPIQDIRAAVYLSNEIFIMTGRRVMFIHDKDIEGDDYNFCAISTGLGFNGFTHHLAGLCDEPLFKIEWGKSAKSNFQQVTDFFSFEDGYVPQPPNGKDDCIVARIVSRSPSNPSKVSFICAGRTAPGTAVAGYFLANNWLKLMQLYLDDNKRNLNADSMVVVIRHNADETGVQEFDSTGTIAIENGQKLVYWAKTAGLD